MTTRRQAAVSEERGAVLLTVLFSLITLLAVAALVIDLGAIRVNRAVSQTVADSAATAGALDAGGGNGRAGCETALDYLEINLPSVGAFTGADCLALPSSCDAITPAVSTVATAGGWVATITYPVRDDSPLLQPSTIGKPGQALHTDDGDACERFGVTVQSTHDHLFGKVLGATSQNSQIHSVARTYQPDGSDFALNLLVLERYDCDAISASGGGAANGGILVDAVFNPDTGTLDPGFIAVDSDASGSCGGNGVLDVNGSNGFIRADGAVGCAGQVGTHVGAGGQLVGEGCGSIELISPGTPGCNYPSCTSGGTVAPPPTPRTDRVTRAPVDHRYNCKANYPMPSGWGIDPCGETPDPHVDDLVHDLGGVGLPAGYRSWQGAGYSCNSNSDITVPADDWFIDCNNFRVKKIIAFEGGNIVFDGDISLTASGVLAVNVDTSGGFPYGPATSASTIYVRDGRISKGGQSSILLYQSTLYLSNSSDVKMTGGAGLVVWSAPISGDFEDLALWAESTDDIDLAGSSGMDLEGVFFAPWATIGYQGSGSQVQVAAQFIARRLAVGGNGVLVVRPSFSRAVLFPLDPQSQLIR